jgi:hypothetical protein
MIKKSLAILLERDFFIYDLIAGKDACNGELVNQSTQSTNKLTYTMET